jgi:hypothetical protein
MLGKDRLFETVNQEEIWKKYCSFLDLSLLEFMEIQEQLLMEQIELVCRSSLSKKFMPKKPRDISEFRNLVPLSTYEDYAVYLGEKNENALAVTPYYWTCTSGRGGSLKWVPWTERSTEVFARCGITALILACANRKGEVNIRSGVRVLANLPPPPYSPGILSQVIAQQMGANVMPPLSEGGIKDFAVKTELGFQIALRSGVDILSSLTSVLIKMGERFVETSGQIRFSRRMLHPLIMRRLITAWLQCKMQSRTLLPKDLWPLKGLLAYGMDTNIYRDQLKYYWGKEPLEIYSSTESGTIATQTWNRKAMTFVPFCSFREFIPEEEWLKSLQNKDYQPSTVLVNELEPGKRYEVVVTSYYGMPFLRYRLGDLIRVVALEDEEVGIKLPQIVFESRADDLIDIAGFTRLDERTIWHSIAKTGIKYEEWTVRKEDEQGHAIIRLYIELKEDIEPTQVEKAIHKELSAIDRDYESLESMLGMQPLRVVTLPAGSFQRYYEDKQKAGAELAHLKPPHMNPSNTVIQELLKSS